MITVDIIKNEIVNFTIEKDIVDVEFEEYILEVDLKDLKGMEVNKDNLAKIIYQKYKEGK